MHGNVDRSYEKRKSDLEMLKDYGFREFATWTLARDIIVSSACSGGSRIRATAAGLRGTATMLDEDSLRLQVLVM
jgi:hypothetical protein